MRIETREDAVMLREVLAPIWANYYAANGQGDTIASTNMCCQTSAMIHAIDPRWQVVHGAVNGSPHAWCRLDDGTVLDLTGDQFGAPAVVWGELPPGYAVDVSIDCRDCSAVPVLFAQEEAS